MTRSIPGTVDMRMLHFLSLTAEEQTAAIRRLIASGMSEHGVSHATGLSVEQIRRLLSEAKANAS